jgi:hypothetical protein
VSRGLVLALLALLTLPPVGGAATRIRQPDGKRVVLTASQGFEDDIHAVVRRYKAKRGRSGRLRLDPTFGVGGRVEVRWPAANFKPVGIVRLGDGRLVIGGSRTSALRDLPPPGNAFGLASLTRRGATDRNFGPSALGHGGFADVDVDGTTLGNVVPDALDQSGGELVLTGSYFAPGADPTLGQFAFARFTLDGALIDHGIRPRRSGSQLVHLEPTVAYRGREAPHLCSRGGGYQMGDVEVLVDPLPCTLQFAPLVVWAGDRIGITTPHEAIAVTADYQRYSIPPSAQRCSRSQPGAWNCTVPPQVVGTSRLSIAIAYPDARSHWGVDFGVRAVPLKCGPAKPASNGNTAQRVRGRYVLCWLARRVAEVFAARGAVKGWRCRSHRSGWVSCRRGRRAEVRFRVG